MREVQARNLHGRGRGESTDIVVTATPIGDSEAKRPVTVIVESKGCWNKELLTAMQQQLKGRYLIDEGHRCGLYLVAWFKCDAWNDESDTRRRSVPDWTFDLAVAQFDQQAEALSDGDYRLRAVVIDARLFG